MTWRHEGQPLGVPGYSEQRAFSARIRRITAYTLATTGTNVFATIDWNGKSWDHSGRMWSPAVPDTLFAPVGGVYLAEMTVGVTGSAWTGYYTLTFGVNGAQRAPGRSGASPGDWEVFNLSTPLLLNAGDRVTTIYEKRDASDSMNIGQSGFSLTLMHRA